MMVSMPCGLAYLAAGAALPSAAGPPGRSSIQLRFFAQGLSPSCESPCFRRFVGSSFRSFTWRIRCACSTRALPYDIPGILLLYPRASITEMMLKFCLFEYICNYCRCTAAAEIQSGQREALDYCYKSCVLLQLTLCVLVS